MKKKFNNEDLDYLNGRINRLSKKFGELEDLFYKWNRGIVEEIDEIKKVHKVGVKRK